jgi:hypothetical protein
LTRASGPGPTDVSRRAWSRTVSTTVETRLKHTGGPSPSYAAVSWTGWVLAARRKRDRVWASPSCRRLSHGSVCRRLYHPSVASGVEDRELIVAVSRALVASIAPEESALFRPLSTAHFEHPERRARAQKDDMLGFGSGEVVAAVTPVVLTVVGQTLVYLRAELAKTVAHDAAAVLDAKVKALFHSSRPGDQPAGALLALSREQLAGVRGRAIQEAIVLGLSEERANLLADALVGSLVLPSGGPDDG